MPEKPTEKTEKSERRQFRAVKGTRDILPPDSALWNWFEQTAREVFESYHFRDIRLPIFEETSLFARSVGADTDIVGKEMYTFEDRAPGSFEDADRTEPQAYLQRMMNLYAKQEIPHSEYNRRLLQTLRALADDLQQESHRIENGPPDARAEALGKFQGFLNRFHEHAAELERGETLSLRPEATAGVCRAYIEHGMQTLPGNQKLYYVGPMFRRERPQKGRYRQFYQIGAEVLGSSEAPAIDAEVLEMLLAFFHRVGLANVKLSINSIGHHADDCRRGYVEKLRAELRRVKDRLKEDSQRRIETNPLRVLDSKLPEEQPTIENLPRISAHLCGACRDHFAKLKEELALRGIACEENWRLVRGLDYYTRTTFEVTAAGLGSQNAVCGGGRYDGLVELLGGPAGVKGIGFAIGTDRAILSIQESGHLPNRPGLALFIAWMGAKTYPPAVAMAKKLRARGLSVELPPEEMKFKKSLGLADKLGARYALIIGEDEVASGAFTLKRLADGQQQKLTEEQLLESLPSERRT